MTLKEVAKQYGRSLRTIMRWLAGGHLKIVGRSKSQRGKRHLSVVPHGKLNFSKHTSTLLRFRTACVRANASPFKTLDRLLAGSSFYEQENDTNEVFDGDIFRAGLYCVLNPNHTQKFLKRLFSSPSSQPIEFVCFLADTIRNKAEDVLRDRNATEHFILAKGKVSWEVWDRLKHFTWRIRSRAAIHKNEQIMRPNYLDQFKGKKIPEWAIKSVSPYGGRGGVSVRKFADQRLVEYAILLAESNDKKECVDFLKRELGYLDNQAWKFANSFAQRAGHPSKYSVQQSMEKHRSNRLSVAAVNRIFCQSRSATTLWSFTPPGRR
ncbi:MAG: hypothetical protein PHV34_14860 [Verrucomicrobiae bacterium]|nr:hypothetical protein [Verrucomicrobiae bacterium]